MKPLTLLLALAVSAFAAQTPSFTPASKDGSNIDASAFKTALSLSSVEDTALSTWPGNTSITTLGTITTGIWGGTVITDSYISSATAWNAKQSAITFGTGVQTALGVNVGSAGAPVLFNGAGGTPSSITLTNASGTAASLTAGLVSSIGSLTGDVTSSNRATTLATVNSTTGSFGSSTAIPTFTVNGKGLITAASTSAVIAPAGTLSGATLASGVTASSLTSFGSSIALGTPASGTLTNCNGTASGLTAGHVTTNADLTGAVTSSGNATSLGSFTIAQLNTALSDADVSAKLFARTTSDQDSTTTTPADTTLSVSLGTGVWMIRSNCSFRNPSGTTQGFGITIANTGTMAVLSGHYITHLSNQTPNIFVVDADSGFSTASRATANDAGRIYFEVLYNVTVAGTYKIQMQQGTSTANTTRLRLGSWIEATKEP